MYESLIPVNSLLRIFRISRGMYDICCPFLDSLPLHRPQPLPLLLCWICFSLPLLFMAQQFLNMASSAPFCTAGDVTTSCSTTSDCQVSLADLLVHHFSAGGTCEYPRSQIFSVVCGTVTEKDYILFRIQIKVSQQRVAGLLYLFA